MQNEIIDALIEIIDALTDALAKQDEISFAEHNKTLKNIAERARNLRRQSLGDNRWRYR